MQILNESGSHALIACETSEPTNARPAQISPIEYLLSNAKLQPEALDRARRGAAEAEEAIEATLCKLGLVSERDMADAFSQTLGLPIVDARQLALSDVPVTGASPAFLRQFHVLPFGLSDGGVQLLMANPLDAYAAHAMELFTGCPVVRNIGTSSDIESALDRLFANDHSNVASANEDPATGGDIERLRDLASDAPVIRLVGQIITRAVDARASDIHIEPAADRLVVRYRIDGVMREIDPPPLRLRDAVVSRVKIMAGLNIAERRRPQDGRMSTSVRGTEIDFRVSTVPSVHGESVVIRVLDRDQVALDFDALGFDDAALAVYRPILDLPHGIVLVTGPTGSGKTTTLYASLAALNHEARKIMTIEDPVEYHLDRIVQVQVQPQIGLTFAQALRAFLRQNPNVVMVGEIRDLETATVAVQASLTGHMILSTLHTNNAATGITRMLDIGVEHYLLVSTVNAIMAQRLVRTLCPACRLPFKADPMLLTELGIDGGEDTLYRAVGCPSCGDSGYRGRTTILEILPVTDTIRDLVMRRATSGEIQHAAVNEGMRTMHCHGMAKALAGITTVEEVVRVTRTF